MNYYHQNLQFQSIVQNLSLEDQKILMAQLTPIMETVQKRILQKEYPFLSLVFDNRDLEALTPYITRMKKFKDVIVLGTGGSSLGTKALYGLKDSQFNQQEQAEPQLHVVETVDPFQFNKLISKFDWTQTGLIVISKSGQTTETLMQFLTLIPILQDKLTPQKLKEHILAITMPQDAPLRQVAKTLGIDILDHPVDVGGRYSVFSLVSLLPALIANINGHAVRNGACGVLEDFLRAKAPENSSPVLGALLAYGLSQKSDCKTSVLLNYSDQLDNFGLWYRQLWAESLGKNGKGTTPIHARGPVDQHSQLQLWLDGPCDKFFTIVGVETQQETPSIKTQDLPQNINYLANRNLADLLKGSFKAVARTLDAHNRPVRTILLPKLDEQALGALFMHFMLETLITAELFCVNPINQPAVEDGKKLVIDYFKDLSKNEQGA